MTASGEAGRIGTPVHDGRVLAEWIDINAHMNVAYYVLAFDLAVDRLWERFGITGDHVRTQSSSTFAVECHITWQRELQADAPFVVTSEVLAYDSKRIHQFMRMYHTDDGYLAATAEWMNLHVDLETRRVAPWPHTVHARIADFSRDQSGGPMPDEAGQRMCVKHPDYAIAGYPKQNGE